MTRDSILWTLGMIGAVVIGLAANFDAFPWISVTAQHWISLAAFVAGIISAKLATSPLPSKRELAIKRALDAREQPLTDPPIRAGRIDPNKIGKAMIVGFVVMGAPSCATSQLHQATVASTGLYTAIAGIDDTEKALYTPNQPCVQPAPCISKDQHDALNPKILDLLKAGRDANDVVIVAGRVPPSVQKVIDALARFGQQVTTMFPDGPAKSKIQTAIIGAQTAASLLLAFGRTTQIGENHGGQEVVGSEHRADLGAGRPDARADRRDVVGEPRGRAAGARDSGRPGATRQAA
jgi:hypothetical protein